MGDILELVEAWGPCAILPGNPCPADRDSDGRIGILDLLLILVND